MLVLKDWDRVGVVRGSCLTYTVASAGLKNAPCSLLGILRKLAIFQQCWIRAESQDLRGKEQKSLHVPQLWPLWLIQSVIICKVKHLLFMFFNFKSNIKSYTKMPPLSFYLSTFILVLKVLCIWHRHLWLLGIWGKPRGPRRTWKLHMV